MTPEERSTQKAKANEVLAKIRALLENAEFQWFMDTVIKPNLEKEAADGLSISKSPEDRNNAAQRHHAINQIAEWLTTQQTTLEMRIKSLDS